MEIVLASASPRRRELMGLVTPRFAVEVAQFEEAGLTAPTPARLAGALAAGKAKAVAQKRPEDLVIGCDTVVELAGRVLGKPANAAQAADMLRRLAGRAHLVHTGVALRRPGAAQSFVNTTRVWFDEIPAAAIAAYVQTNEPYDKAGGYGIQGWAAKYTSHIEGCYYNVMGLPVAALRAALEQWEVAL